MLESIDGLPIAYSSFRLQIESLVRPTKATRRGNVHTSVIAMGCVSALTTKVVRLVMTRRKRALIEAQIVVCFPGIGTLGLRDETTDFVRVPMT